MLFFVYIQLALSQLDDFLSAFHQPINLYCSTSTCPYGFKFESTQSNAIYINCSTPKSNSLILSQSQMSTITNYNYYSKGYFIYSIQPIIVFDVYFHSQWNDDDLIFQYNNHIYNLNYSTQNKPFYSFGFCDTRQYQVQTFNISLPQGEVFTKIAFKITNPNLVAFIQNIHFSYIQCYPGCYNCTGSRFNQCTTCLTPGMIPINGECRCPVGTTFNYYQCSSVCQFYQSTRKGRVCYQGSQNYLTYFSDIIYPYIISWNTIFDSMHPPQIQNKKQDPYFGIFKFYEGASIVVNRSYFVYPLSVQVRLIFCNQTPPNSGVQFYFNNIYHSSVYFDGVSYVYDNLYKLLEQQLTMTKCSSSKQIFIILNNYINSSSFVFGVKGNFTNGDSGWYLAYEYMTSGYCPNYCLSCNKEYSCLTCYSGLKQVSDGTCVVNCPYGSIVNSTHCLLPEHYTKYSKYFVRLFEDFKIPSDINNAFILESFTDKDFKKGEYVYWSYLPSNTVFGGKHVWANARFSQIYKNLNPHHSISILFIIYFGYLYPSSSYLGYEINNGTEEKVYANTSFFRTFDHQSDQLSIAFQCNGDSNNVFDSYCAISHYQIIIHYCRPFCLNCTDEFDCIEMSTYDSSIIKINQSECQSNQFLDENYFTCENCPIECSTCFNDFECYTCNSPYILYVTKCLLPCQSNQYYESQSLACINCDQKCKQCRHSPTNCINCEINYHRYLYYGECKCYDGYYDSPNFLQCQVCHTSCTKCTGPTNYQCLGCISIQKMNLNQNTCQCDTGYFFNPQTIECQQCNQKCLNCFSDSENSCSSCDISLNRIIKGFQCQCSQGYFEVDNNCVTCSINEDLNQYQCYKQCGDNSVIWFNQPCPLINCNLGFDNLNNQCFPKCGDGLVKGNEECDDQNNIPFDGCYNCKFHCPQECLTCNSLTTLPCQSICGDGIISGNEECDDQNINKNDGCYDCKIECQIQCTNCLRGQCYECQTCGWIYDPGTKQCIENCGDSIVIGQEQCDDGYNFDPNDGCFQCQKVCREDCKTCSSNGSTCLECKIVGFIPVSYYCVNICGDGYLAIDPYGRYKEQCDDFNTTDQDGCSKTCTFQCQPIAICTNCVSNICQQCADHYYLNQQQNKCIEICNDNFVIGNEKCEDMNNQMLDGCYNCQLSCQQSCQTCTEQGCTQCIGGFQLINQKCVPICGDGKKVLGEECDDGNLIPFDGCHGCQFSCSKFCQICNNGVCLLCEQGLNLVKNFCEKNINYIFGDYNDEKLIQQIEFFIPFCQINILGLCLRCWTNFILNDVFGVCMMNNTHELNQIVNKIDMNFFSFNDILYISRQQFCENYVDNNCLLCKKFYYLNPLTKFCEGLCGDGSVGDQEECDDRQNDQCQNCIQKCQDQCTKCVIGKCFSCQQGYFFNQTDQYCTQKPNCLQIGLYYDDSKNVCYDVCGDGIISPLEECDDDSDETCQNCKYQCGNECISCRYGQCLDLLEQCDGYYFDKINKNCFNICGDGLIAEDAEECDDGNGNQYCIDCKLQCDQNCKQCLTEDICQTCNKNYTLQNGKCFQNKNEECGNGYVDYLEQCDDGNLIDFDGCDSDCSPSQDYFCQHLECVIMNPFIPLLYFIDEKKNVQTIKLNFNQKAKINSSYNFFNFQKSLELHIENVYFYYTFDSYFQDDLNILINLEYLQQVQDPQLTILFTNLDIISTEEGLHLSTQTVSIQLPTPCFMTQNEIEISESLIAVSNSQMKIIFGLIIGFLFTGQFSIIQNQLDTMQQFYYLKYINTKLPYNLENYFETFRVIQITNLYDLIGFNPSSNVQLESVSLDYCTSKQIFERDDRNANFLVNFILLSGIFLTAIFSLLFFNFVFQLIMKKIQGVKPFQLSYSKQYILHKIIEKAINQKKINIYEVTINLFQSILYELSISIFLSIKFQKIDNSQSVVSLILAFGLLLSSILFILMSKYNKSLRQKKIFDEIFIYSCAQRMVFASTLVFCFNNLIIQSLICNLNEILFILYLNQKKTLNALWIRRKQIIHLTLFLVETFLLLNEIFSRIPKKKIIFGWICIGIMSFSMFMMLMIDILILIKPLIDKIIKLLPKVKLNSNEELFFNIPVNQPNLD